MRGVRFGFRRSAGVVSSPGNRTCVDLIGLVTPKFMGRGTWRLLRDRRRSVIPEVDSRVIPMDVLWKGSPVEGTPPFVLDLSVSG